MTDTIQTATIQTPAEALSPNAALLERILRAAPRATDDMMTAGVAAANATPPANDGAIGHRQVRAAWDAMAALLPGLPLAGVEVLKQAHERRVTDLVDANNAMLERARQAERDLADARADVKNAEAENMLLRRVIRGLYAAATGAECPLPLHATAVAFSELETDVRERAQQIKTAQASSVIRWVRRAALTPADVVRLYGEKVHIRTENGIWRLRDPETGGGFGYTNNAAFAERWSFSEAWKQTDGLGPEKAVSFGYREPL